MQLSQGGFAPELGLGQQNLWMQRKEAAGLQYVAQTARQTPSSSKYPKRVCEQFLTAADGLWREEPPQPAQMEAWESMDAYRECASQSPVTSDPPPVLPLFLLRTVLNSLKVSLCTV